MLEEVEDVLEEADIWIDDLEEADVLLDDLDEAIDPIEVLDEAPIVNELSVGLPDEGFPELGFPKKELEDLTEELE